MGGRTPLRLDSRFHLDGLYAEEILQDFLYITINWE